MKLPTISLAAGWRLTKAAFASWIDDYGASMGAALAYYTVFSIAPLLLIVIAIAGLVFGEDAARGEIFGQINGLVGAQGAAAIQTLLDSVNKPAEGAIATATGIVLLLVGATTVFGELQDALDRIWRAPEREKSSGVWSMLRSRFLSFGMVMGIGFLSIVSLVLSAAITALEKWWAPHFVGWEVLANLVNIVVGFVLTTGAFALIYKIMPRVRIAWHDVLIGAVVTAFLFIVGKFAIGLYISTSGVASGFGAAASLVVVLVWVYYSAQIFLIGAEFTWVYAHEHGSRRGAGAPAAAEIPSKSSGPANAGDMRDAVA